MVPELRVRCCTEMVKRNLPGYAIGGMSGGEDKEDFWKTVKLCCELLPHDKPKYVMGVGYAEDCMVAALLGADMFDCVFATRTARFGSAFTKQGMIKIKKEIYADDFGPVSEAVSATPAKITREATFRRCSLTKPITQACSCLVCTMCTS